MLAFEHLKEKLKEDKAKQVTGSWNTEDKATKEMVRWCQDQWRRNKFCFPEATDYVINVPSTMCWIANVPVCFKCGTPCPNCREEL